MTDPPSIQHWLVAVARAAGFSGADGLDVAPDTPAADAWKAVRDATGKDDGEIAARVARHYRLDVASPADRDPTAVRLLPASTARRHGVVPLRYTDRTLTIATADPVAMDAEREVGELASRAVVTEVAPPDAVRAALAEAYPARDEEPHRLPPLPAEETGRHVLVVEDDAATRALLRATLESGGFRVTEAPDGKDALEVLARESIHLVTLDLQMIEIDGLEVLRRMRGKVATAAIPVIVATGTDDPDVEMEALEAGADDFVVKPVDPPRFLLRVQAVLRRYGAGRTASAP